MMISNFLPANAQHAIDTLTTQNAKAVDLKAGTQIDARISSINQQKTEILLSIGNKRTDVIVHNETSKSQQQANQLQSGQNLKLLITKPYPQAEFKILVADQKQKDSPTLKTKAQLADPAPKAPLTLKAAEQNKPRNNLTTLQTASHVKNPHLSKLSVDQKITASVVNNNKNLTLKLFTPQAVTLEFSKSNLAKGINSVSLQVIKSGEHPQFKLLPTPTPEESINNALKELLPKEQSTSLLLNQLVKNLAQNENVSETLKRLAQDILRNLPTKQQLTESSQLKKNIDNSGLFLEAKLAQSESKPASNLNLDLKAKLTQLVNALQQDKGVVEKNTASLELQTKSEGALARLVLNQLKSLPQDEANRQVWTVELPFVDKKQAKSLQIQIEEENHKNAEQDNKTWSATLSLEPPNLSPLHCKISFFNGTVHANFWSETGKTTQIIEGNLDYLSERFEAIGLKPGNLNAQQKKHTEADIINPKHNQPLFNDNA